MSQEARETRGGFRYAALALLGIGALVGLCIGMMKLSGKSTRTDVDVALDTTRQVNVQHGAKLYHVACATCHGPAGKGLPHQGAPLAGSAFVGMSSDAVVMRMIKMGRTANDPASVLKLPMPAKGGYSRLTDNDLQDIVAFIRTLGTTPTASAGER